MPLTYTHDGVTHEIAFLSENGDEYFPGTWYVEILCMSMPIWFDIPECPTESRPVTCLRCLFT